MSKQDELKQLQDEIEGHRNAQTALSDCITDKCGQIADIRKQIADAEKPNMKLGDMFYGSNSGKPVLMTGSAPDGRGVYEDGARAPMGRQKYSTVTPTFNAFDAFDDLTALQEDVTDDLELRRYDEDNKSNQYIQLGLSSQNELFISTVEGIDGQVYHLKGDELAEVKQYIQRAEATLKRNNK